MRNQQLWRYFIITIILFFLSITFHQIVAQQTETCSVIVESALEIAESVCDSLGRNEACYGNSRVEITSYGVLEDDFASPGDQVDVADIETLTLGSMRAPDEWGIALLKIQANVPDTVPGQNVTMILIGNVHIKNEVKSYSNLQITPINNVNLRNGAGTNFDLAGVLNSGEVITVNGRNEAGDWLRVQLSETEVAWVFAPLVTVDGDSTTLTVVSDSSTIPTDFNPMQAFYLLTGIGDAMCREASESGLLIQTPEGVGTMNFMINGVEIALGSTAFIQSQPGGFVTVSLLEGNSQVISDGFRANVIVGAQAAIPVDENGIATDPPQQNGYNPAAIEALPLDLLDRPITLPRHLTDEEVNERVRCTAIVREAHLNGHVGPGRNRGALLELPTDTLFRVIGQAPDSEGATWYQLNPQSVQQGISHENIWVAYDDVKSIGGCRGVPAAEIPPIILATDGAGADVTPLSGTWRMTVLSAESTGNCPYVPIGTPLIDTPCYGALVSSFNRSWDVGVADNGLSMTINGGFPYENISLTRVSPTNFSGSLSNIGYQISLIPLSETEMQGIISNFSIRIQVSFVRDG